MFEPTGVVIAIILTVAYFSWVITESFKDN